MPDGLSRVRIRTTGSAREFPPGTELCAGPDPTDAGSVPEHVELSLPLPLPGLTFRGGVLLVVALVEGLRRLRSRRA